MSFSLLLESGGTRYYYLDKLLGLRNIETDLTIAYARVSSHDQKEDLKRQAERLEAYCLVHGWNLQEKSRMSKVVVIGGFTHAGITESGASASNLDSIFAAVAPEILSSLPTQGLPQAPSHAIFGTRGASRQLYMSGVVVFNYFRKMGHETHLINTIADRGDSDSAKLAEAEFVMISTSHMTDEQSIRSIEISRSINPGAIIVVGGWTVFFVVQAIRATALKYSPDDAERILGGLMRSGANHIVASRSGLDVAAAIVNGRSVEPVVFDDTMLPPLSDPELLDFTEMPEALRSSPVSVTTALGCPFDCAFCSYRALFPVVRRLEVFQVLELVRAVLTRRDEPVHHFRFADEVINWPYSRLEAICDALIQEGLICDWSAFARVGNIDGKLARKMKQSGCSMISLGLESGDEGLRKRMNKSFSNEEFAGTVEALQSAGIAVAVSLIIGFPGERPETIASTRKLLDSVKPDCARLNIFMPFYETRVTPEAKECGLKVESLPNGRGDAWSHSTMDIFTAYRAAAWLVRNTSDQVFAPPWESFLDEWSALRSLQIPVAEILFAQKRFSDLLRSLIRADVSFSST